MTNTFTGINLRNTQAYVNDGTSGAFLNSVTYSNNSASGNNFGYLASLPVAADANSALDPRLAGYHSWSSINVQLLWALSPGNYLFRCALDATSNGRQTVYVWSGANGLKDGSTSINSTVYVAWAISTAVAVGKYTIANGCLYKCITAGTTASSGTGPSGTGNNIQDGTAYWAWVQSALLAVDSSTSVASHTVIGPDSKSYTETTWPTSFPVGSTNYTSGNPSVYDQPITVPTSTQVSGITITCGDTSQVEPRHFAVSRQPSPLGNAVLYDEAGNTISGAPTFYAMQPPGKILATMTVPSGQNQPSNFTFGGTLGPYVTAQNMSVVQQNSGQVTSLCIVANNTRIPDSLSGTQTLTIIQTDNSGNATNSPYSTTLNINVVSSGGRTVGAGGYVDLLSTETWMSRQLLLNVEPQEWPGYQGQSFYADVVCNNPLSPTASGNLTMGLVATINSLIPQIAPGRWFRIRLQDGPNGPGDTAWEDGTLGLSKAAGGPLSLGSWSAGMTVAVGQIVHSSTNFYKCVAITTGITGSSAPTGGYGSGDIVDGGVTWNFLIGGNISIPQADFAGGWSAGVFSFNGGGLLIEPDTGHNPLVCQLFFIGGTRGIQFRNLQIVGNQIPGNDGDTFWITYPQSGHGPYNIVKFEGCKFGRLWINNKYPGFIDPFNNTNIFYGITSWPNIVASYHAEQIIFVNNVITWVNNGLAVWATYYCRSEGNDWRVLTDDAHDWGGVYYTATPLNVLPSNDCHYICRGDIYRNAWDWFNEFSTVVINHQDWAQFQQVGSNFNGAANLQPGGTTAANSTCQYLGRVYTTSAGGTVGASLQGTISGTVLTLTANAVGTIQQYANLTSPVSNSGLASNSYILGLASGTAGQTGATYNLSVASTVSSATAMYATLPPVHTSGSASDGGVTWTYQSNVRQNVYMLEESNVILSSCKTYLNSYPSSGSFMNVPTGRTIGGIQFYLDSSRGSYNVNITSVNNLGATISSYGIGHGHGVCNAEYNTWVGPSYNVQTGAVFIGTISNSVLTVNSVVSGSVALNQTFVANGVTCTIATATTNNPLGPFNLTGTGVSGLNITTPTEFISSASIINPSYVYLFADYYDIQYGGGKSTVRCRKNIMGKGNPTAAYATLNSIPTTLLSMSNQGIIYDDGTNTRVTFTPGNPNPGNWLVGKDLFYQNPEGYWNYDWAIDNLAECSVSAFITQMRSVLSSQPGVDAGVLVVPTQVTPPHGGLGTTGCG